MENIFDDITDEGEPVKMTKDEFIQKTKQMLRKMMDKFSESHHTDNSSLDEDSCCDRCHGFTQIEQGGNIVDCYECNGTGEAKGEVIFDSDLFGESIAHDFMFGNEPFYELMECEILN